VSGGEAIERPAWDASWLAGEPIPVPEPEEPAGINHPQIHALQQAAEQLRATRHWSHVDPDVAAAHREAVDALAAELAHHTHILEPRDDEPDRPAGHPTGAGEGTVTVIGNLTAAPRLTRTKAGTPVANLTIATRPRAHDPQTGEWKDGTFVRCTLWREAAENAAASLAKGTRVIATGTLTTRPYQAKDGQTRTSSELDVHELGTSIRFATARVARRGTRPAGRDIQPRPRKGKGTDAEGH
jgi:single-strand DNA-binding protein